jgi:dolichol-phosphate mannosyltransferase
MDSDGQHPPELIPELVRRWQAGADIVQTIRKETGDAGLKKRLTSSMFYFLLNKLGDTHVIPGAADFRLMSREAVDALQRLPEKARFIRGLVSWIGFRVEYLEFDAPARSAGTTKYSFIKMLRFALDGITSFSTVLLRMAVFGGLLVVAGCLVYALIILAFYLFHGSALVSGWSSLMLALLFMGGLNLICLGIVGEYIGRIYSEVKNRPLYILRKRK